MLDQKLLFTNHGHGSKEDKCQVKVELPDRKERQTTADDQIKIHSISNTTNYDVCVLDLGDTPTRLIGRK